jgi:hypothetical protein
MICVQENESKWRSKMAHHLLSIAVIASVASRRRMRRRTRSRTRMRKRRMREKTATRAALMKRRRRTPPPRAATPSPACRRSTTRKRRRGRPRATRTALGLAVEQLNECLLRACNLVTLPTLEKTSLDGGYTTKEIFHEKKPWTECPLVPYEVKARNVDHWLNGPEPDWWN